MKRKTWGFGLLVAATATGAAVILLGTEGAAHEPSDASETELFEIVELPVPVHIDTIPPERTWPFQELPLITKFAAPLPEVSLVASFPPPIFERALVRRLPTPEPEPAVDDDLPLWMLPLPAAAFVVGSDQFASTTVIPEPSTLVLLSTGLLLVGWSAVRRRREKADELVE